MILDLIFDDATNTVLMKWILAHQRDQIDCALVGEKEKKKLLNYQLSDLIVWFLTGQ